MTGGPSHLRSPVYGSVPEQSSRYLLARHAVAADWPGIEVLRDACYARWNLPVQVRDDLAWLVYEYEGRVVCAAGYSEPMPGFLSLLDWYAEEGRQGKRGGAAVLKLLLSEADHQGKTISGVSCFEVFIAHALRRGFRFAGVALVRAPQSQGGPECHQQS